MHKYLRGAQNKIPGTTMGGQIVFIPILHQFGQYFVFMVKPNLFSVFHLLIILSYFIQVCSILYFSTIDYY